MNIAIIPARAKSKRIKDKNIVNFLGRPIIHWSILKAKKSKIFDEMKKTFLDADLTDVRREDE